MKDLTDRQNDEIRCTNYCIDEANKRIEKDDYIGAAVFLENAHRSLKELDVMQKEQEDLENGKVTITGIIYDIRNAFD